ncbi:hypothetical protein LTR17_025800 [Elasticomyces elasticus]|nr:hypothetical protein LTR17_025800 [Elasticomyces elasticus]
MAEAHQNKVKSGRHAYEPFTRPQADNTSVSTKPQILVKDMDRSVSQTSASSSLLQKALKPDQGQTNKVAPTPSTAQHTARTRTSDAARLAVINTTELLEAILLNLPAKQTIVVQRVSRQFHESVRTSVPLQRKLFLRPSAPDEEERWSLVFPRHAAQTTMGRFDVDMIEVQAVRVKSTGMGSSAEGSPHTYVSCQPARRAHALLTPTGPIVTLQARMYYGGNFELDIRGVEVLGQGSWREMHL